MGGRESGGGKDVNLVQKVWSLGAGVVGCLRQTPNPKLQTNQ